MGSGDNCENLGNLWWGRIFGSMVHDGRQRYFTPWILVTSLSLFSYTDSSSEFPSSGTSSFNTHSSITCQSSPEISSTLSFGHSSAIVSGSHSLLSESEVHSVQRCVLVDY